MNRESTQVCALEPECWETRAFFNTSWEHSKRGDDMLGLLRKSQKYCSKDASKLKFFINLKSY